MKKKRQPLKFKRIFKKRPCRLCKAKVTSIDFKDSDSLSRFITDRGKIVPPRLSGNCSKHQRMVVNRIKRARIAGLVPYVKIKQGVQRERYSSPRR